MKDQVIKKYKNNDMEFNVTFNMLKPSKSLKFLLFMGKLIGGSAGQAISALDGTSLAEVAEKKGDNLNIEKLGESLFKIMDRIDEDQVVEKINLLFSSCEVNGQQLEVDHLIFHGDPTLIFKLAKEALVVNYKRFLDEISSKLGPVLKKVSSMQNTKESPAKPE
jgi:hypothetical protein